MSHESRAPVSRGARAIRAEERSAGARRAPRGRVARASISPSPQRAASLVDRIAFASASASSISTATRASSSARAAAAASSSATRCAPRRHSSASASSARCASTMPSLRGAGTCTSSTTSASRSFVACALSRNALRCALRVAELDERDRVADARTLHERHHRGDRLCALTSLAARSRMSAHVAPTAKRSSASCSTAQLAPPIFGSSALSAARTRCFAGAWPYGMGTTRHSWWMKRTSVRCSRGSPRGGTPPLGRRRDRARQAPSVRRPPPAARRGVLVQAERACMRRTARTWPRAVSTQKPRRRNHFLVGPTNKILEVQLACSRVAC